MTEEKNIQRHIVRPQLQKKKLRKKNPPDKILQSCKARDVIRDLLPQLINAEDRGVKIQKESKNEWKLINISWA